MVVSNDGAVSLNDIHVQRGGGSGTPCSLNDSDIRQMVNKTSGAISFDDFRKRSIYGMWTNYETQASLDRWGEPLQFVRGSPMVNGQSTTAYWVSGYGVATNRADCVITITDAGNPLRFTMSFDNGGVVVTAYLDQSVNRIYQSNGTNWYRP